jgi:WD40 repeat protein
MNIPSFTHFQFEDKKITHNTCISCILAEGDKLYVAGLDGQIKIWTLGAASPEGCLKGHTDLVNSLVMLKDKTLLSASDDNSLIQWDLKARVGIIKLVGHEDSVTCCLSIPNRRLASSLNIERDFTVVSGSWDRTIRIWDITKKRSLRVLKGHVAPIKTIEYCETNGQANLVTGSSNGEIYVWELLKFSPIHKIQAYTETVNRLLVVNDSIVSAGNDNCLRAFDSHLNITDKLNLKTPKIRKMIIFRRNFLITLCGVKTIEIWNIEKKCLIQKKEFQSNLFELNKLDDDRIMIANRNEGWVMKYVNKPLLLTKALHKFRTEMKYPPIIVKQIHDFMFK